MKTAFAALIIASCVVVALVGCGGGGAGGMAGSSGGSGSGGTGCPAGSETCACSGGTCNAGLTCASNLCVRLPSGGAGGRGGAGGSGGGAGTSAGGRGGAGGTAAAVTCGTRPVPIDSSGWVDLASTGCGIEGAWWWAKDDRGTTLDGVVVDQAPFAAGRGMCIKGSTVLDPTYAAWGAIIGLDLAGNRAAGWDATARTVVGFDVEITGSSGGAALRLELESTTGRTTGPPFVPIQSGTSVALIDRAIVPLAWDVPNRGEKAVASNLRKLQLHVVGGEGVSAFDVCIKRVTPIVSTCSDFALVDAGGYVLNNNTWGKEAVTGYSQCVFASSSSNRYGWLWRWPANPSGQVHAYPELMAGRSPWTPINTGHGLPAPISSNVSLTFKLDLEAEPTGVYNFAPEVWLTSAAVPSTANITHELMFWFTRNNMTPAGTKMGSVTNGGVSYDVYINPNHNPGADAGTATGWTYVAFVATTPVTSGTIDLKPFLDHLAAAGRLTGAAYTSVVDFGTELVNGSGSVIVSNFSVTVRP